MNTIGIKAIGTYLPERRIDNRLRMNQFAIDESFLRDKSGMMRLAVKDAAEETSDLCCSAFKDLQRTSHIKNSGIDCIVVCTQNPDDCGLPHTSAVVHAKLGLPSTCASFDISMGCSGFVYGLSVIQSFMMTNGFSKGVLFTADPYSKIIDENDKNTSLLFGDGATASLIAKDPNWRSGMFVFGSRGEERDAIHVQRSNGKLTMNGRAVYSYSATAVPKAIIDMLALNDLTVDNIDCFALHQGSRYIVDTVRQKLGVDPLKVPFMAGDYGNTVSSSVPMLLKQLSPDHKRIVIAGFGVGLSIASTVLFKCDKE